MSCNQRTTFHEVPEKAPLHWFLTVRFGYLLRFENLFIELSEIKSCFELFDWPWHVPELIRGYRCTIVVNK